MTKGSKIDHAELDQKFPAICDLEKKARQKLPGFAFNYLSGGIGNEAGLARNRAFLENICLEPRHIVEPFQPVLHHSLLGQDWSAPFGIAPIGLSGLIWPDMAKLFAQASREANIPAVLSTVATTSIEKIADISADTSWFQLYVPNDEKIAESLVERARHAGIRTLVVTVDVPALGRREKDIANGLSVPPKISLTNIWQGAMHPHWAFETLKSGLPTFENLTPYVDGHQNMRSAANYVSSLARGHVSADKLARVRAWWDGSLLVKGIISKQDALAAKAAGADGLVLSNHGARQLDAALPPGQLLPDIRQAVGADFPLVVDSGVRSGLDIARLLAMGADFVLLGRAFCFGAAALGWRGPYHVHHILASQLANVMSQVGAADIKSLKSVGFKLIRL